MQRRLGITRPPLGSQPGALPGELVGLALPVPLDIEPVNGPSSTLPGAQPPDARAPGRRGMCAGTRSSRTPVAGQDPWKATPKESSRAAGVFTRTSTEVIAMKHRTYTPTREAEVAKMLVAVLQAKVTTPLVRATWALAAMTAALVAATVVLALATTSQAMMATATILQPNRAKQADTGWDNNPRIARHLLTSRYWPTPVGMALVRFRTLWERSRGGSSPLARTRFSGNPSDYPGPTSERQVVPRPTQEHEESVAESDQIEDVDH